MVVAVTLLAGTSVAVAGPISFVGLLVPHGRPGPTAATATAPAAWRNWSAPRSRPART
ncbi:iron chelate uptake ABC transporter family permease subunit [Streptomyces sp. NPDC091212]|uniref:iron chelate uptake ABC transporter family permease subunit n=1 Tax=Streptomyces sp. NPDC091212 TaxID=3155191 RepID=UPI003447FEBB